MGDVTADGCASQNRQVTGMLGHFLVHTFKVIFCHHHATICNTNHRRIRGRLSCRFIYSFLLSAVSLPVAFCSSSSLEGL